MSSIYFSVLFLFRPGMLFINNMIDTALLFKLFAQHIGHSTAVMLLPFFRSHYLFNFHIHRWRRRPMVIIDFVRAPGWIPICLAMYLYLQKNGKLSKKKLTFLFFPFSPKIFEAQWKYEDLLPNSSVCRGGVLIWQSSNFRCYYW